MSKFTASPNYGYQQSREIKLSITIIFFNSVSVVCTLMSISEVESIYNVPAPVPTTWLEILVISYHQQWCGFCSCNIYLNITDTNTSTKQAYHHCRALQFIPALASKETFFTRQEKHVTCQINKDTNLYYTTPICIYLWIIINALNETEDAQLRNGLSNFADT